MLKNKNGTVKCQIHLYSEPELYKNFKETLKQLNTTTDNSYGISEIIRVCMLEFCNSDELQQKIIATINRGA